MNHRDARDLLSLAERFISGADRTPQLASEIEGIVIECCQDEQWFDEVSEALALFVPGGGGYYLNEDALASELGLIVPTLRDVVVASDSCDELDPPDGADGSEQCG
jgi:hypothetical protein